MKVQIGSVVKAAAGRDRDSFFVVTAMADGFCMIADGKSRKLASPKRKNMKHLHFTDSVIELNDITDKKLRTMLRGYNGAAEQQEVI